MLPAIHVSKGEFWSLYIFTPTETGHLSSLWNEGPPGTWWLPRNSLQLILLVSMTPLYTLLNSGATHTFLKHWWFLGLRRDNTFFSNVCAFWTSREVDKGGSRRAMCHYNEAPSSSSMRLRPANLLTFCCNRMDCFTRSCLLKQGTQAFACRVHPASVGLGVLFPLCFIKARICMQAML